MANSKTSSGEMDHLGRLLAGWIEKTGVQVTVAQLHLAPTRLTLSKPLKEAQRPFLLSLTAKTIETGRHESSPW